MRIWIRIGLIWLCSTTIIVAAKTQFQPVFISQPQAYQDAIFGLTSPNTITKFSLSAQKDWSVIVPKNNTFTLRFNRLISWKNGLSIFDTNNGIPYISITSEKIKKLHIQYPYIFYLTAKNRLYCRSIKEGAFIWESSGTNIKDFTLVGHGNNLLGMTKNKLILINIGNGDIDSKYPLPKNSLSFAHHWDNNVIIQQKNGYYWFNTAKKKRSKITLPSDHKWVHNDLYFIPSSNKTMAQTINLHTQKSEWSVPTPNTPLLTRQQLLLTKTSENYTVFNLKNNKNVGVYPTSANINMQPDVFHIYKKKLYFISKTTVGQL